MFTFEGAVGEAEDEVDLVAEGFGEVGPLPPRGRAASFIRVCMTFGQVTEVLKGLVEAFG